METLHAERSIDLLVTDVGLPGGMNGRHVADVARTLNPEQRVLFVTGYAASSAIGLGQLPEGMQVMTKPFELSTFSERVQAHHQSKSKAQFKEAVTINKSISALGNCIQALANNSAEQEQGFAESYNYQSKRNLHIPFRDCKLTRLLAEPLGGNSKTCIIVNIGPCTYNFEETKSTLKFAKRYVRYDLTCCEFFL